MTKRERLDERNTKQDTLEEVRVFGMRMGRNRDAHSGRRRESLSGVPCAGSDGEEENKEKGRGAMRRLARVYNAAGSVLWTAGCVCGYLVITMERLDICATAVISILAGTLLLLMAPGRAKKERLAHLSTFNDLSRHYNKIRRFMADFDEKRSVKVARRQKRHGTGKRKEKWRKRS